jgi:hypothetical protein
MHQEPSHKSRHALRVLLIGSAYYRSWRNKRRGERRRICAAPTTGANHVQEGSVARGLQVSCGLLFCQRGNTFLSLPLPGFCAYLQHRFYRDAPDERRALPCPCHSFLDFLLPRLHPKMEKPIEQLDSEDESNEIQIRTLPIFHLRKDKAYDILLKRYRGMPAGTTGHADQPQLDRWVE